MRLWVPLMVLALAACGGQEGGDTPRTEGAAPGATPGAAAEAESAVGDVAAGAAEALKIAPAVQSCLDLVRQARFEEAVPACTEAVAQQPDSEQAKTALEQAQKGAAAAAAGQAAQEAGQAVQEAGAQVEGAAQEAAGKLPKPAY